MFNIFQYEKINQVRLVQQKSLERLEEDKVKHTKKNEDLSSHANIRRLEWAAKFLESDVKNSTFYLVIQDRVLRGFNSTILAKQRDSSEEGEEETKNSALKNAVQKMDIKVFHPYPESTNKSIVMPEHAKFDCSKTGKNSLKSELLAKKPFNHYVRGFNRFESAWENYKDNNLGSNCLRTDIQPLSDRNAESKSRYLIGAKKDVWNVLIKPRESLRAYHSNESIKKLPDSKLYQKSLDHIISRKLN